MVLGTVALAAVLEPKALVAAFAPLEALVAALVPLKVFQPAPASTLPVELNV